MSTSDVQAAQAADALLPHEAPTNRPQSGRSVAVKLLIALALGLGIYLLPTPANLPIEGHILGAIIIPVIFLWVSEAIPIGVTALLATAAMVAFNVVSPSVAWSPYASPAVMFVMMIIMFGVVINEVGLARRILYYILKVAGTNVKRLSFFVAISCTLLSTLFHDATVTIILVFAILPIFVAMGITPDRSTNLSKFFIILIALAASAGGFGTLLGGGRNPLAVEFLQTYMRDTHGVEVSIGFLQYLVIQFPIAIVTALFTWLVVYAVFRPKEKELPAAVKIESMPAMSTRELGVATVFMLAFVLWFLGDFTSLHLTVVAAAALLGFTAPGWVSFKTICDKFPWEAWLVFGSGVSLGVAMLETGLGAFLAQSFLPLLKGQGDFVTYFSMGLFGSLLSSVMSNSAAVALTLPVTMPLAELMGMRAEAVAMQSPIASSFVMLVIGSPPTIIAYSTGYFSQVDFIKVAVPWALILLTVSVLSMLLYWPLIGFI